MVVDKKRKKYLIFIVVFVSLTTMLTGCRLPFSDRSIDKVVLTTGFDKDGVFRIGTAVCSVDEFMLYLTNTQNRYEEIYGSEIWSVASENQTLEDKMKDMVGAQLAQIKIMNLLAKENHVTITEEEKKLVEAVAKEYYSSLNPHEIDALNLTQEHVAEYYTEYLIAHKVYTYIIRDINPEISDDEARTVTVDWIYLKSPVDDFQIKQKAYDVLAKLQSGEDFETVANEYSDDPVLTHSFYKGVESPEIENVAFNLAEGEISDLIFCIDGYYILRCVSTLNRQETDENKIRMVEQRKKEAFNDVYGSFAREQITQLNESCWKKIELFEDEEIRTSNFFDVYDQYLGELKLQ